MTRQRPHLVVVAHDVHDRGGMERAMAEFLDRAVGDFDVTLVSASAPAGLVPFLRAWRQVRILDRPFLARFPLFWLKAGSIVRSLSGDVVVVLGAIVPGRADVAVVQFCHNGYHRAHGTWADPGPWTLGKLNSLLIRLMSGCAERWCYRRGRVQLLTAGSTFLRDEVEEAFPDLPVAVVPNGVEVGRFHPDEATRISTRLERNITSGQVVLLFVGGQWYRKGLDVTIEALGALVGEGLDLVLWIDGPGDARAFRALAQKHGVGDRVHFLGKTQDVERSYRGADVFVLPSAYETFSLAAHEAAASGLPVVATAVGGVDELIGSGEAGIVTLRTADALAGAIRRLAHQPELRAAMGQHGRQKVATMTWDRGYDAALEAFAPFLAARGIGLTDGES